MIALIAAFTKNGRVLGKNGKIPWNIPGELSRFKFLTTGNIVIMGRKTYEEIGKPLPDRINIVISRTKIFQNVINCSSFEKALEEANKYPEKDIFFAGGAQIYKKALSICQKLYLTEINDEYDGDVFFPAFEKSNYIEEKQFIAPDDSYTYLTYTKKSV